MNTEIYCKVINVITKDETTFKTKVRPMQWDLLPISHSTEKVENVLHVTDMILELFPNWKGYDLIIYTK